MVDYPGGDTVISQFVSHCLFYHFDKAVWSEFMEKGNQPMELFPVRNDTLLICLLRGLCESDTLP